jgi:hypothetical protein
MKSILFLLFLFSINKSLTQYGILNDREDLLINLLDTSTKLMNDEDLKGFISTDYFAIDSAYIVTAQFIIKKGRVFRMPTSMNRAPLYRQYGVLNFQFQEKSYTLTVYQSMKLKKKKGMEKYLFIPLKDETTGVLTYGGGRYLNFQIPDNETIELDFNLLYNPYCAYSHRYSCPIPPAINSLKFSVNAGEKTPIYRTIN